MLRDALNEGKLPTALNSSLSPVQKPEICAAFDEGLEIQSQPSAITASPALRIAFRPNFDWKPTESVERVANPKGHNHY